MWRRDKERGKDQSRRPTQRRHNRFIRNPLLSERDRRSLFGLVKMDGEIDTKLRRMAASEMKPRPIRQNIALHGNLSRLEESQKNLIGSVNERNHFCRWTTGMEMAFACCYSFG